MSAEQVSTRIYKSLTKNPHFASEHTLESFVERALVLIFTDRNTDRAIEALESNEVAENVFNSIINALETVSPGLPHGKIDELDQEVIELYIDEVLFEYDGHNPHNLLFQRLESLIKEFPFQETLLLIKRNKDKFVDKIQKLIGLILERKRNPNSQGIRGFLNEYGNGEMRSQGEFQKIESCLARINGKVRLVFLGKGERFKTYRVAIENSEGSIAPFSYTGMAVKVMRRVRGDDNAQEAVFNISEWENGIVSGSFARGYGCIQDTVFRNPAIEIPEGLSGNEKLSRYMVYQDLASGVSINEAADDPFLQIYLGRSMRDFLRLYREMVGTKKKALRCTDLGSSDILVTRCLRDTRERVKLQIVNTTNLRDIRNSEDRGTVAQYLSQLAALQT